MKLSKIATAAAAFAVVIVTPVGAYASDAPNRDIASKIMANPNYAKAVKGYARRRGYQAEAPVLTGSNFLPILGGIALVTTGVVVATKGGSASPG